MKAKDYLKLIRKYEVLIDGKSEELQRMKALSTKITKSFSGTGGVQQGSNKNKIEDSVIKIITLKEELDKNIEEMINIRLNIIEKIDSLKDSNYCKLLYKRYIDNYTWERIAVDMGYSLQWVHVLHGRALQEIQKIINKRND